MTRRTLIAAWTLAAVLTTALVSCGSDEPTPGLLADCVPVEHEHSIARLWNEQALDAVRRDFPAPTVHARNLFHLSSAMYDAWLAFDDGPGRSWFVDEQHDVSNGDLAEARHQAISFAAHRLLRHRYALAVGALETVNALDQLMADLCYDTAFTSTAGDSPAAIGNRIAGLTIAATRDDGANEDAGYDAPYTAVNEPMPIEESGTAMVDPNRWQPLSFTFATAQNGLVLGGGPQRYIGPHWGAVTSFALPELPDPGPPPMLGDPASDAEFKDAIVAVIRASSRLDPALDEMIELSPSERGNSTLGTDDGTGHSVNPATGQPYPPNRANLADWARVVAEFWADGPDSETPPGHWNTLANTVSDHPDLERRLGGTGDVLDQLEWDIRLYFALNGALHDAAISAWGIKAIHDYSRPISMIRYMGGLGQSSDPDGLSFHADGLPLVDDLVEVITAESSAVGERHAHLSDHVGEVAIRAWGQVVTRFDVGGSQWIRAVDWLPYQQDTFVTPAFAAYVSGHSTFSRAGAEILTAITGDPYFPGGLGEHTVPAGELEFEAGPTSDVTLQWATYRDAADEAGQSRIWGGIHVRADDYPGRIIGAEVGQAAWQLAVDVWGRDDLAG